MTPEQLDAIEKFAAQGWARYGQYYTEKLAEHALPLVKALREARAALEWQAAMTKALSESQERLAQEVKEARAEVERLREVVRQVHAIAGRAEYDYRVLVDQNALLRDIYKITKGVVE